ncbi:MAG: SPFH domain-containing protein [Dysgonomonas sp.]|nr:SPFH domain-containing protein [Dysgonomonas sp.]
MKKNVFLFIMLLTMIVVAGSFTSCSAPGVNAGEELVIVKKPIIFGSGGVEKNPITSGTTWKVWTTDVFRYDIKPVKYEEDFDDIMSDENTPLDITAYVILQVQNGKSPILHENYGQAWYTTNIKETFRTFIRDGVSSHSTYDLTSNRNVLDSIRITATRSLKEYFVELNNHKEFPVNIVNVIVDRAIPNQGLKEEMDRTAIQIQAKRTQSAQKEMEDERRKTEIARAAADKAYRTEMGLSGMEFIQLRALEIQKEQLDIIRNKPNVNIDVLLGGAGSLNNWDIKKK